MNWVLAIVFGIPWLLLGMHILESELVARAEQRRLARRGGLAPVPARSRSAALAPVQAAMRSRRNLR